MLYHEKPRSSVGYIALVSTRADNIPGMHPMRIISDLLFLQVVPLETYCIGGFWQHNMSEHLATNENTCWEAGHLFADCKPLDHRFFTFGVKFLSLEVSPP